MAKSVLLEVITPSKLFYKGEVEIIMVRTASGEEGFMAGHTWACKLLDDLKISQSTLSHHMKILCDAGIVQGRKDGKWVHYSINPAGAERAVQLLNEQITLDITDVQDDSCNP